MSIPDAAIEAAAEVLYNRCLMPDEAPWYSTSDLDREEPREDARAAIEAAMPAIREALAQEIEASIDDAPEVFSLCADWIDGVTHAGNIVRGGAA